MLINATKSRLVIGRFSILPGEKVPTFQLTGDEAAAVDKFKSTGRLVEKPGSSHTMEKPAEESNAPVEEAPVVEKPVAKPAGRSRKQPAYPAENKQAEQDAAESGNADSQPSPEQVSQPEGE